MGGFPSGELRKRAWLGAAVAVGALVLSRVPDAASLCPHPSPGIPAVRCRCSELLFRGDGAGIWALGALPPPCGKASAAAGYPPGAPRTGTCRPGRQPCLFSRSALRAAERVLCRACAALTNCCWYFDMGHLKAQPRHCGGAHRLAGFFCSYSEGNTAQGQWQEAGGGRQVLPQAGGVPF